MRATCCAMTRLLSASPAQCCRPALSQPICRLRRYHVSTAEIRKSSARENTQPGYGKVFSHGHRNNDSIQGVFTDMKINITSIQVGSSHYETNCSNQTPRRKTQSCFTPNTNKKLTTQTFRGLEDDNINHAEASVQN